MKRVGEEEMKRKMLVTLTFFLTYFFL